jgi:thiazole synthase
MTDDLTVSIRVNGEHRRVRKGMTIAELALDLGLDPDKVAVERNLEVVPRSTLAGVVVESGDDLEIVTFVGGGDHVGVQADSWSVAGRTFHSRLIVGTGKYKSLEENAAALEASGAEIVTVAVRRVNIADPKQPMLMDFIDPKRVTYLPNTAAASPPRKRCGRCAWRARPAAGRW